MVPALDQTWKTIVYLSMFVCGALALASLGPPIQRGTSAMWTQLKRRRAKARARQAFINDIPFLSEDERKILGYLREKKQKTFGVNVDGGYASTLLGKRYIYAITQPGQVFDYNRMPVAVAEHVWEVILQRPDDFPYRPEFSSGHPKVETYPWRIP